MGKTKKASFTRGRAHAHTHTQEMASFCMEHGIKLLCFGTIAGGLLSEKYLRVTEPKPDTWSALNPTLALALTPTLTLTPALTLLLTLTRARPPKAQPALFYSKVLTHI